MARGSISLVLDLSEMCSSFQISLQVVGAALHRAILDNISDLYPFSKMMARRCFKLASVWSF